MTDEGKAPEEASERMHKRLDDVLNSISDGFFTLDDDLVVTYFNRAAEKFLSRDGQEVLGRNLFAAFPEAKGSIFEEMYTRAVKEKQPLTFETYFEISPYENWYDVRVYPLENGISVYFQVITERKRSEEELRRHRDELENLVEQRTAELKKANDELQREITERKQTEEALRDSHEKYRSVVENADVGIIVIQDGQRVFHNSRIHEMLDYSEKEWCDAEFMSFVHPEDRAYAAERIRQRLLGMAMDPNMTEMRLVSKSGEARWVQTNSVAIQWEGKPAVQAFVIDVTERKRAEEALRESEDRFAKAFHSSPNLMAITRMTDGRIIDVNESFIRTVGYRREELIGRTTVELGLWSEPEERGKAIERFEGGQRVHDVEVQIQTKSGEGRIALVSGEVITLHNEPHLITVASDITERKEAEERLKAALKEKEVLLKEVYHRTKNNMATICSLLRLHSARIQDEDVLRIFKDTTNRIQAMALVQEKLYRSRDLANINLKEYIADLARTVSKNYRVSPGKISLIFDAEPLAVSTDTAIPCGLILNELLSNAAKYAFPGERSGEIRIALHAAGAGEIELRVGDNGVGMPEGFDFGATDSLGLQLVKRLVEHQLGGAVDLRQSDGTEFHIRFKER